MSLYCSSCGHKVPEELIREEALQLEEKRYAQMQNPLTKKWTLVDKWTGRIKGHYDEQVPLVEVGGAVKEE